MSDPGLDEAEINRLHREKMERRQAARRKVLATKTEERGLLIVHTGAGKGKSTAAFGMVLRCLGHGMRVGIVQFVKGAWGTGERDVLARFPDLVTCRAMGEGFTWDTQDRARDIAAARAAWEMAKTMIADPSYRLVLLDELNIVMRYDYLPLDEVLATLQAKPRDLHVVLCGHVSATVAARDYRALAPSLLPGVLSAFRRLATAADLVLVEGAGSPAEVNLRAGDIANMGFAEAADVPVALIGDIERGGVIAQLVGTHALLSPSEQSRLVGYIVNKFRGDPRLFDGGIAAIGERLGLACFGVVPYFPDAALLPAEDTMSLCRTAGEGGERTEPGEGGRSKVAVPLLPRIANFD